MLYREGSLPSDCKCNLGGGASKPLTADERLLRTPCHSAMLPYWRCGEMPPGPLNLVMRRSTILVIDDNADAVTALAQILEYEGYSVATAYDGREALQYLATHPLPGLIILDLMMPVMNGWEFRATLAKQPNYANVPVVIVTALAEAAEIDAAAIIPKPIDLKRLLGVVDRLLVSDADSDGSRSIN